MWVRAASAGWSHSKVTPQSESARPSENTISVADGNSDTIFTGSVSHRGSPGTALLGGRVRAVPAAAPTARTPRQQGVGCEHHVPGLGVEVALGPRASASVWACAAAADTGCAIAPSKRVGRARDTPAPLICDPVQYDFGATVRAHVGDEVYARLLDDDPALDAELEPLLDDPGLANFYRSHMVTHGTETVHAYLRELSRFTVRGLAPLITCPTLVLEAEGDPVGSDQSHQFVADLTCPATEHRFTHAEGAGGHCEGLGQRRLERVVYGWLATTLRT